MSSLKKVTEDLLADIQAAVKDEEAGDEGLGGTAALESKALRSLGRELELRERFMECAQLFAYNAVSVAGKLCFDEVRGALGEERARGMGRHNTSPAEMKKRGSAARGVSGIVAIKMGEENEARETVEKARMPTGHKLVGCLMPHRSLPSRLQSSLLYICIYVYMCLFHPF